MPVKYIDVTAKSDLFVPATRAFGDIAIVGKGVGASGASGPHEFTDPASPIAAYLTRSVADAVIKSGSTTVTSAANGFATSDVGRAVTGTGILSGTTIVKVTNAGSVELSAASTGAGTGVALSGLPGEHSDLGDAIAMAFRQSPPPTRVWGVQVDATTPDWDTALTAVAKLDVQIVALANTPLNSSTAQTVDKLATHVSTVSNTGGDGKERIGVAMLDSSLTASAQAALNTGTVANERMFLIAHRSSEDVAAAAAGVIAGVQPHISVLLKPININQDPSRGFSDSEIDTLDSAFINWVTSPVLIPGSGVYLGEGYTANPGQGNKKYIDVVRTLDDINFRVKAELIQAMGNLRVSRSGLRAIETLVEAVLSPLMAQAVIEDYSVFIRLLVLLSKDPASLSAAELQEIQDAQASRKIDMAINVTYAGAIHRLHIDLVFK
ncbi:hypothetical protein [Mycobacterium sp.]|uniref:hypothetical protein n=1 Tax=Mycobacterium sp. TaxID=1785 RepID=UPI003D0FD2ED